MSVNKQKIIPNRYYRCINSFDITRPDLSTVKVPFNSCILVEGADDDVVSVRINDEVFHLVVAGFFDHFEIAEMEYKSNETSKFVKADEGKIQWTLLPFNLLEDVVRVLEFGAKQYGKDNWKNCDDVKRYEDALMRHVISYVEGDKIDPQTGKTHLAHAICNCLFLMWFDKKNQG